MALSAPCAIAAFPPLPGAGPVPPCAAGLPVSLGNDLDTMGFIAAIFLGSPQACIQSGDWGSLLSAESPSPAAAPSTCQYVQEPCPAQGSDATATEAARGCGVQMGDPSPTSVCSPLPPDLQCQQFIFQTPVLQLHGQQCCIQTVCASAGGLCWHSRGCLSCRCGAAVPVGDRPGSAVGAYPSACPCAAPRFLSPGPWPPAGGGEAGPGWRGRVPQSAGRTVAVPCRSPGSAMARAPPGACSEPPSPTDPHPSPGLGCERPHRRQVGVKAECGPGEERGK